MNIPMPKAVYLTSPTYYGFCSDLSQICRIAHQNNMIVLVDEAHGAHFQFHDKLPKTALSQRICAFNPPIKPFRL